MKPKKNYAEVDRVDSDDLPGYDGCQTPPYALDPLLPFLEEKFHYLWDPACGEQILADTLRKKGFEVLATDLISGDNFFNFNRGYVIPGIFNDVWESTELICTNPPYSLKYRWIKHCYELGKPWALLMPVETGGAAQAQDLFKRLGVEIMYLDHRVNFKMPGAGWGGGGAQFPVAWFCWKVLPESLMYGKIDSSAWDKLHPKKRKVKIVEDFSI